MNIASLGLSDTLYLERQPGRQVRHSIPFNVEFIALRVSISVTPLKHSDNTQLTNFRLTYLLAQDGYAPFS